MDRNCEGGVSFAKNYKSLSARRAWIEIFTMRIRIVTGCVALRKESVDRNCYHRDDVSNQRVALRKESVDRNQRIAKPFREQFSRSPQGERG